MRQFSIGAAISAGFRLIGSEPLAFLAWVLVYAVLGIGPQLAGMGVGLSAMGGLAAGVEPDQAAMARALGPLQALQPLSLVTGLASILLLYGAVYRACFYPDDRRFLYLRLGARELWMGLTFIVLMVIYFLAILAMLIPFFIVVAGLGAVAAAGGGGGPGAAVVGGLIGFLVVMAALVVILWGAMRLSLAMPMSFVQRSFRLPEAWRLTAGHGWRIFVVMLAVFAMLLLLELALIGVGAGLISLFTPLGELGRLFAQNPAQLFSKVNPAVWVVVVLLWSLLGTWSATMFSAALAEIYRGLTGPDTASVFD